MKQSLLGLDDLMTSIKKTVGGNYDVVVGIERGGVLPAYLVSRWLNIEMLTMKIVFRNDKHQPVMDSPKLLKVFENDLNGLRVLLVDDVSNTGATFKRACQELPGARVTTMTISGDADISLFGQHDHCIQWPWD